MVEAAVVEAAAVVVVVEVVQDMNTHRQAGRQEGTKAGNDPNPSRPIEPRQDRRQE